MTALIDVHQRLKELVVFKRMEEPYNTFIDFEPLFHKCLCWSKMCKERVKRCWNLIWGMRRYVWGASMLDYGDGGINIVPWINGVLKGGFSVGITKKGCLCARSNHAWVISWYYEGKRQDKVDIVLEMDRFMRELEVGNELDCVVPDGSCIFSGSTSALSGYDFLRCTYGALFHIDCREG